MQICCLFFDAPGTHTWLDRAWMRGSKSSACSYQFLVPLLRLTTGKPSETCRYSLRLIGESWWRVLGSSTSHASHFKMAAADEFIEFLGNQLAKGTGMVGVIVLHLVLLVSISVSQVKQLTFNKYKCCLGSLLQLKHIHVLLVAVMM